MVSASRADTKDGLPADTKEIFCISAHHLAEPSSANPSPEGGACTTTTDVGAVPIVGAPSKSAPNVIKNRPSRLPVDCMPRPIFASISGQNGSLPSPRMCRCSRFSLRCLVARASTALAAGHGGPHGSSVFA
jgi:hypothetical protein